MAQVLIRGLDPELVERLRAQAKRNGRSLEAELRIGLESLVKDSREESIRKAREIQASLKGRKFSDSTELIREDRER